MKEAGRVRMWLSAGVFSIVLTVLAGCAMDSAVDCAEAEEIKTMAFAGKPATGALLTFCESYPRGVHIKNGLTIDGTMVPRFELGCVCSVGNLVIANNPELVALSGLENVGEIRGGIEVASNPKLQSLVGLPQVASIGEMSGSSIVVEDNDLLEDLVGLPADLIEIPGSIGIRKNDGLRSLSGLPDVAAIEGGILISANPRLRSLAGLPPRVESVASLGIFGAHDMLDLSGLPAQLSRIEGEFSLSSNGSLRHLVGIPAGLERIGSLRISSNDELIDLSGLPVGLQIDESVEIMSNDGLRSLSGLPEGLQIGRDERTEVSLYIRGNDGLEDLSGLPVSLTSVPGRVILQDTAVKDLTGLFDHLRDITGLALEGNPGLRDLAGIPDGMALRRDGLGWSLYIVDNPALESLRGLPESLVELPGGISITGNDALVDLTGLEHLRSVGGELYIGKRSQVSLGDPCDWELALGGNAGLQRLTGLSSLGAIAGRLVVACNPALVDVDAFFELGSIGGSLYILDNRALERLTGLGGPGGPLREVGGTYAVYCSHKLDPIEVEGVIAEVVPSVESTVQLHCL